MNAPTKNNQGIARVRRPQRVCMLRDAWLSRQAKSCRLSTVVAIAIAVPVPVIPVPSITVLEPDLFWIAIPG